MARRAEIEYLVVGHVCVDLVGEDRPGPRPYVLGGSATYAALTARNLGQRVGVLTSADFEPAIVDTLVGRDNFLVAANDLRVVRLPAAETTCFVNVYEPDGRRQQVLALAEPLRAEHVPTAWRGARVVHLAPVAREVQLDLVSSFSNALLGVTPQGWMRDWDGSGRVRPVLWDRAAADVVLERADVLIFSEEDVSDPAEVGRYAERARLLVITEHREGAVVYERGKPPWRSPAFRPARVADPTGAGDTFAAGFLTHYHRTGDPRASADYANCVASFVVERRAWHGLPTPDQVEERLKRGARSPRPGARS